MYRMQILPGAEDLLGGTQKCTLFMGQGTGFVLFRAQGMLWRAKRRRGPAGWRREKVSCAGAPLATAAGKFRTAL